MSVIHNVRVATSADAGQVARLFDLYRCFYGRESNLNESAGFISERLKNKDSVIFIVETTDGTLAGFTQLYPIFSSLSAKKAWVLNDLFVCHEFRSQGVASKLIQQSLAFCKNAGAEWVSLQTATDNFTAQKLYQRLGFIQDTQFLNYYYNFTV
ncbi:MAG: GNAT family N-acetyltransferase [Neisseriales bacterium]|jgi:ribosomal protein S18 acetylase RimI-like enzyme|nr:MAG: GNAT family N-acetyltransferase [Neisseriales bacterium]